MEPEQISAGAAASPRNDTTQGVQKNHAAAVSDELAALRALLVGPEQRQLRVLQEQFDSLTVRPEDVGRVLPEAILLRLRQDHQLPKALTPLIETALQDSIKNTPRLWVDSLFPLVGSTVRRAIAHTLRSMLASLNQTLEQSLSLRSLRWRWEAWRTGKSFSEVLILRTLRYRVEQVFLIHNKTGLLLQHVSAPSAPALEGELMAGMLTAIQDFVHDVFGEPKDQVLETVQLGEFTVWIERGTAATLAAVIRGNAPEELRTVFQDALDNIHLEQGGDLASFQGDTTPFTASREHLEFCLQMQLETKPDQSFLVWKLVGVALLVAVGIWSFLVVRDNRRWENYLTRLQQTPGIVITTAERRSGKFFVAGLRDPLAEDPLKLLVGTRLDPERVLSKWEMYHALQPDFILARAKAVLAPPATVTLSFAGETLTVTGVASHQWIDESRKLARVIPGVSDFKTEGVVDADAPLARELAASKGRLEKFIVYFIVDTAELASGQDDTVMNLTTEVQRFFRLAQQAGKGFLLEIVGHTDTNGSPRRNSQLRQERAESVRVMLLSHGVPKEAMTAIAVEERVREEVAEQDKELNRCVTFRVIPLEAVRTAP